MGALKNPKWEAFAQAVAMGESASSAYRQHVATSPDIKARGVEVQSSKLQNKDEVAMRIRELRESNARRVEKRFEMTRDDWLERLASIAEKAEDAEDFSAATGALTQIGKATDYYAPRKIEVSGGLGIDLGEAVKQVFGKQ